VTAFVGAVAVGHEPLNVLQLLWVNIIMDSMGALALATEDPAPEMLNDKPHGRDEPLITRCMWKHILVQRMYQLFWTMVCLNDLLDCGALPHPFTPRVLHTRLPKDAAASNVHKHHSKTVLQLDEQLRSAL